MEEKDSIADIIKLADCGLLVSENTTITMNVAIPQKSSCIVYLSPRRKYVVIAQNEKENEQQCVIPIFSLTQAGQDILKATLPDDKEGNSLSIAKKTKEKNDPLAIKMFKVKNYDDNTGLINHSNEDLLQEQL